MTEKFIFDDRCWDDGEGSYYQMIYPDYTVITAEEFYEVQEWCEDPRNGKFVVYYTGIEYYSKKDLMMFMLRWV